MLLRVRQAILPETRVEPAHSELLCISGLAKGGPRRKKAREASSQVRELRRMNQTQTRPPAKRSAGLTERLHPARNHEFRAGHSVAGRQAALIQAALDFATWVAIASINGGFRQS